MRRLVLTGVVVGVQVGALGLAVQADAATHPGQVTLGRGVISWRQNFTTARHYVERAVLMQIDLRTARLDAGTTKGVLGAARSTVKAQADATRAVGGVNADFFPLSRFAVPRGAVIRPTRVLKTPRPGWRANLLVRANGTATIGDVPFVGSVTRPARTAPARAAGTYEVHSVNSLNDAAHGRITFVTPDLLTTALPATKAPASCTVADGDVVGGHRTIVAVHARATRLAHPAGHRFALVACGRKAPAWLATELKAGDPVSVSLRFPSGRPRFAVSGGRVLVYRGRAYNDVGGQVLRNRTNPETFACVTRTGTSVLLGVIDGRSTRSRGVDYPELTTYMISLKCYIGMTFDGGGSATMVARLPRHRSTSVLNVPSDGTPRPVADTVLVYAR